MFAVTCYKNGAAVDAREVEDFQEALHIADRKPGYNFYAGDYDNVKVSNAKYVFYERAKG